ncbi:putative toxin-antitoxin system toxin component, PIN family [Candidatus Margulisiibacteriota bacterium]
MLKVVFDTNIFVSGIIWQGLPGEALANWLSNKIELVISRQILEELTNTLRRLDVPEEKVNVLLNQILGKATIVDPQIKVNLVKKDPSDNKFLECAIEGKVGYVISGDKHLLEIKKINGIQIISARKLLELL